MADQWYDQWYILRDGKRHGPYSGADLKKYAASGHLLPIDLVVKDGMAKPVPAAKIKGLFAAHSTPEVTPHVRQTDGFGLATDEVRSSHRTPTTKPNRTKLFFMLGGGSLLAVIVAVAFFALVSGSRRRQQKARTMPRRGAVATPNLPEQAEFQRPTPRQK